MPRPDTQRRPYPHPSWPARWMWICGISGVIGYFTAIGCLSYAAAHYIIKFW